MIHFPENLRTAKVGTYDLCHACRHAISDEDKNSPLFEPGVSCPKCHCTTSQERKTRFAERQKQMELARARGEVHLGSKAVSRLKQA